MMYTDTSQKNIDITGNENTIVRGDLNHNNYYSNKPGKLSCLFTSLKMQFENSENSDELRNISESLKRYLNPRDTIGLEEKLSSAGKSHLEDDFIELKQIFNKKLIRFQNYEPAQDIFTFLLAIILEKYRNIIKPMLRAKLPEEEILSALSEKIINPLTNLIQSEGSDDIMGLTSDDIEGMYHYLTGNCHINWIV